MILPAVLVGIAFVSSSFAEGKRSGSRRNGGSDGGGGGAFVCREKSTTAAKGAVIDSELADLWEARTRPMRWEPGREPYRLNIPYTDEGVELQLRRALDKLKLYDPILANEVADDLEYLQANIEELPDDVEIEVPFDAKNIYRKTDCPLEGMMYFDGVTKKLSLKPGIFSKLLSPTLVAASWMHEALYKTFRYAGWAHRDSTEVRRINACLFSTDNCFGDPFSQPAADKGKRVYRCSNAKDSFTLADVSPDMGKSKSNRQYYQYAVRVDRVNSLNYPYGLEGTMRLDLIPMGGLFTGKLVPRSFMTSVSSVLFRRSNPDRGTLAFNPRVEFEADAEANVTRIRFVGARATPSGDDVFKEFADCKPID